MAEDFLLSLASSHFGTYYLAQNREFDYVPYQQEVIAPALEAVERREIDRLAIFMPPGHSKTTLITVHFSAWHAGRHPEQNILLLSYSSDLAVDASTKIRRLINSDLHKALFPNSRISFDTKAKDNFAFTRGGHVFAIGFNGVMVGRRCNLIIIDDPVKGPQSARSEADERFRRETYTQSIENRLEPGGRIILVMHRWPGDSFSGWLLERDGQIAISPAEVSTFRRS